MVKTPIDHFLFPNKTNITRICAALNCNKAGDHRAPKSPKQLRSYYYFCLVHVQEYNKRWNFYEDMSEEEAYQSRLNDLYGERPTWPMGQKIPLDMVKSKKIYNIYDFFNLFDRLQNGNSGTFEKKILSDEQYKALDLLKLKWPTSLYLLKKNYKKLAKKYHPDVNQGNKESLEHFKKINQAYQVIKLLLN